MEPSPCSTASSIVSRTISAAGKRACKEGLNSRNRLSIPCYQDIQLSLCDHSRGTENRCCHVSNPLATVQFLMLLVKHTYLLETKEAKEALHSFAEWTSLASELGVLERETGLLSQAERTWAARSDNLIGSRSIRLAARWDKTSRRTSPSSVKTT